MKRAIFLHEIKAWAKSPLLYLLCGSFFLFSLMSLLGTGGFFDGPSQATEPVSLLNSPYSLVSFSFLLTKFMLFAVATFAGFSLYRDYQDQTHHLLYSFPISRTDYLVAKLSSAGLLLLCLGIITLSGIGLAEIILGVENPYIGPDSILGYVLTFLVYLMPTLITVGVLVFVVVGFSRNIYSGFILVLCVVLFQLILENLLFNQRAWLAWLDPLGQHAFWFATQDWDFAARNAAVLPLDPWVVGNRLLWGLIAGLAYWRFATRFDFQYDSIWQRGRIFLGQPASPEPAKRETDLDSPIQYGYSIAARVRSLLPMMRYAVKRILGNWTFLLLGGVGGLAVFFILLRVTNTGEFNLLPFTRLLLGPPLSVYVLVVIFGTFLFSGFLMHRARRHKMSLIVDATAVENWQLMLANLGAIALVQVIQLLLFMLIGITIQMINGWHHFEWSTYAFHLFILVFPTLLVWNVTSHLVHALVPNIFLGLFLLAGIWLGDVSATLVGNM
ncbi:MAG: ABC transporter permease [Bacteroidota bacterium]